MKKTVVVLCLIGSALIIFDTMNAAESLTLFLFAGIVPGTNVRISPIDMMAASATAITIVMLRLTLWPLFRPSLVIAGAARPVHTKRTGQNVA
jgi:hypothetical protein